VKTPCFRKGFCSSARRGASRERRRLPEDGDAVSGDRKERGEPGEIGGEAQGRRVHVEPGGTRDPPCCGREVDMARPDKTAKVEDIRERFLSHEVVFLADFTGLKAQEINELRFKLREMGAELRVLKNTLTLLAIKGTEYEAVGELLVGPIAAAFVAGDPMAIAKELVAFSRANPKFALKGGYMEGRLMGPADVRSLATLPPREVLLAKVAGSFKAPLYGLCGVLSGPYRKLVYALRAVADARSEAA